MRNKRVIQVKATDSGWWFSEPGKGAACALPKNVIKSTVLEEVVDSASFKAGDPVILRIAPTSGFIGTRGPASKVVVDAGAFVEDEGKGDGLQPASLYEDQLARRLRR
jgi:hypothetical protein